MSNLIIKTADINDVKLLVSLAKEIWTQHYLPIIGQEQIDYMLRKYQSEKAIENDILRGHIYYIAYSDDTPCGYSLIKDDEGVFLSKFYVSLSQRGKGVGKKMIEEITAFANEKKAPRIWLTCNKYNSSSLAVYKKLGFNIIDSIVSDIGNGFVMDDYVLEKPLEN